MKIPVLIILVIGIFPDEQNIAFGGVDTGRTNPKDDASAIATATGIGLIPAVHGTSSGIRDYDEEAEKTGVLLWDK